MSQVISDKEWWLVCAITFSGTFPLINIFTNYLHFPSVIRFCHFISYSWVGIFSSSMFFNNIAKSSIVRHPSLCCRIIRRWYGRKI
jgi:hypothetical protein